MKRTDITIGDRVRVRRGAYVGERRAGNHEFGVVRQVWRPDRQASVVLDRGERHTFNLRDLRGAA